MGTSQTLTAFSQAQDIILRGELPSSRVVDSNQNTITGKGKTLRKWGWGRDPSQAWNQSS